MTKQVVSTGTTANDGTGDSLKAGADKINSNFTELYNALGGNNIPSNFKFTSYGTNSVTNTVNFYNTDPGTDQALPSLDTSYFGELKVIINQSGAAVSFTGKVNGNTNQTIELASGEGIFLVWAGSGTGHWWIIGNQSLASIT